MSDSIERKGLVTAPPPASPDGFTSGYGTSTPGPASGSTSSPDPAQDQAREGVPVPPLGADDGERGLSPHMASEIRTRPLSADFSEKSVQKSARPGGDAQVKAGKAAREERLVEHHRLVQGMVDEWLADLPAEMRGRALVRVSLTNMARAQLALDSFLDRVVRGERIPIGEQESMRKLASDSQAFKTDLLSRWPKAEERAAAKPIPVSVSSWFSSICNAHWPTPMSECGCRDCGACGGTGSVLATKPTMDAGHAAPPGGEGGLAAPPQLEPLPPGHLGRDAMPLVEPKPARVVATGKPEEPK